MDMKPLLSFSFSKKKEPTQVVVPTKILGKDDDGDRNTEVDFVTSIDDQQIVSTKPVAAKKELVIPLIQNNNWRLEQAKKRQEARSKKEVTKTDQMAMDTTAPPAGNGMSLEEKACRELIQEARNFNEESEDRVNSMSNRVIPIFMANRVPEGFEADDDFDVSARAENPSQEDYEQVPVEEFGMAMLRGMGFRPEDAKKVPVVDVKIRPKGLGLGAEIPAPTKQSTKVHPSSSSKKEEELELKNNAQVYVTTGKHKGFYGVVEGFDEDMLQADVHLVIPNMTVAVPVVFLRVVSRDEFRKESKVLNKSSFEDYKSRTSGKRDEDGQRQQSDGRRVRRSGDDGRGERKYSSGRRRESDDGERNRNSGNDGDGDDGDYDNKGVKREADRERSGETKKPSAGDENGHHRRHDHQHRSRHPDDPQRDGSKDRKDGQKFNLPLVKGEVIRGGEIEHQKQNRRRRHHHHQDRPNDSGCWLRSGLRVRIIDRDFRKGKHHKEKVEIIDIEQPGSCSVLTSDRLQLNHVMAHMVETVVPRVTGSKVLILKGIHKNEAGILIHRDSERQQAQVQLVQDREQIGTYHFDHICEFVGDDGDDHL